MSVAISYPGPLPACHQIVQNDKIISASSMKTNVPVSVFVVKGRFEIDIEICVRAQAVQRSSGN